MGEQHFGLRYVYGSAISFLIGACSSLFGIGGGPLLVPVLIYILGLEGNIARGTSLALVVVSGVSGLIERSYVLKLSPEKFFDWEIFLAMTPALVIGSLFISNIIQLASGAQVYVDPRLESILRRAFGGLLILIGLVIVYRP